ncbi:MAG TPA: tryptophan synthase subunit alpha [Solirubrobacteraceae bacterium]|nr:tryptophan synthase subunit alpha [Solirubrobacteraceae bacterium]
MSTDVHAEPIAGAARIRAAFAAAPGRAALMPYLMGGFPDMATSDAIAQAYADGGADLVELGVPFSDPIADGPVIQAAATRALAAGATLEGVLGIASRLAPRVPVVLMLYANLVLARGVEAFAAAAAQAGVSGVIVPDLPLEEAPATRAALADAGLALIPLVAPTTTAERLARIGADAQGFLYTVSVTGITGERASLSDHFAAIVARARAHTTVPVALGFGISTPEQAAAAADAGADGVIVGSRLVREAGEAADPVAAVRALVTAFAQALR